MTASELATRPASSRPQTVGGVDIDWQGVYKTLRLNPGDPATQALLVVCDKYGLDPLLKHAVLIEGRVYVTRDGLLHVAHKSGQFDGIEVIDGPKRDGLGDRHATVAVYRKDMSRPITYPGRYPKDGKNSKYRPEMAVKVAEVQALRRAFNVALATLEEQWDRQADSGDVYPADDLERTAADQDHQQLVAKVETSAAAMLKLGMINEDQRAAQVAMARKGVDQAHASLARLTRLAQDADAEGEAVDEPVQGELAHGELSGDEDE